MSLRKRADPGPPTVPTPVSLGASGDFDGNDGKWSTFFVNVGDDGSGQGQNFKVLISTSSPLTLVPNQANWCTQDCASKRGVQIFDGSQSSGFDPQSSKAWSDVGIYNIPLPHWWSDGVVNATYGSDNVGLGASSKDSKILSKQYVGRYDSRKLFMGSFGLSQTYISTGGGSQPPFLVNFAESQNIPSISYGYGAGASYRKLFSPPMEQAKPILTAMKTTAPKAFREVSFWEVTINRDSNQTRAWPLPCHRTRTIPSLWASRPFYTSRARASKPIPFPSLLKVKAFKLLLTQRSLILSSPTPSATISLKGLTSIWITRPACTQ
jgi:hypothetical protein